MNPSPLISVAICTYNRADRLVFALDGLSRQSLPTQDFEILLVDNASTDDTRQVGARYQEQLPNLRYIYEPVQGLSKARNTAMQQACGEYIAYLDDDAIPCEVWLENILKTFQTVEPTPVCVGGPIYPLWELPKPEWLHKYMEALFTVLDYGNQPQWFRHHEFPFGANMTYQLKALHQVGGFCEQLGRRGKSLLSQEEYLLNLILEKQGGRFYYSPEASVQHWVPKERVDPSWLIRRSYWQGRSEALAEQRVGNSLSQQKWKSLREVLNVKRLVAQAWPNRQVRVTTRARLARSWGYFLQTWFHTSAEASAVAEGEKVSVVEGTLQVVNKNN